MWMYHAVCKPIVLKTRKISRNMKADQLSVWITGVERESFLRISIATCASMLTDPASIDTRRANRTVREETDSRLMLNYQDAVNTINEIVSHE